MSELKVYHCNEWHNEYTEFYMKDEADKAIAELKSKLDIYKRGFAEDDKTSELKDRWFWAYPTESVDCDGITGSAHEVYSKSEVDEVIAEKDEEIAELKALKAQAEDDCAYWKMCHGNAANAMHETEEYAMQLYNEARHHKYKRCLAMAMWCGEKWADIATPYGKSVWYNKWQKRWLSLANKFKEGV